MELRNLRRRVNPLALSSKGLKITGELKKIQIFTEEQTTNLLPQRRDPSEGIQTVFENDSPRNQAICIPDPMSQTQATGDLPEVKLEDLIMRTHSTCIVN